MGTWALERRQTGSEQALNRKPVGNVRSAGANVGCSVCRNAAAHNQPFTAQVVCACYTVWVGRSVVRSTPFNGRCGEPIMQTPVNANVVAMCATVQTRCGGTGNKTSLHNSSPAGPWWRINQSRIQTEREIEE